MSTQRQCTSCGKPFWTSATCSPCTKKAARRRHLEKKRFLKKQIPLPLEQNKSEAEGAANGASFPPIPIEVGGIPPKPWQAATLIEAVEIVQDAQTPGDQQIPPGES